MLWLIYGDNSPLVSGTPLASTCQLSWELPTMKESLEVETDLSAVTSCLLDSQDELHIINIPDHVGPR